MRCCGDFDIVGETLLPSFVGSSVKENGHIQKIPANLPWRTLLSQGSPTKQRGRKAIGLAPKLKIPQGNRQESLLRNQQEDKKNDDVIFHRMREVCRTMGLSARGKGGGGAYQAHQSFSVTSLCEKR